jgi:HD-like signal output (HDOD) protein
MATDYHPMFVNLELCEATRIVQQLGIPPCPPLLADLIQELAQPQPDRGWVVQLIEQDAELAQALLAAVNSPLCGLRHKVSAVRGALTFGGLKYCANFMAGFMLRRALTVAGRPELEAFWERAAERSFVIAYLARELGVADFDEAHTFGLFRNCGIPLMLLKHPDYGAWLAAEQTQGLLDITGRERARYGIDHALIGGLLARSWCLPMDLWLPVSLHHLRDESAQTDGAQGHSGGPQGGRSPRCLIAIGILADCLTRLHRQPRLSEFWEDEQAFALQALGLLPQQLTSLQTDIGLLLEAP